MQVSNPHESVISDIYCGTYGTESLFSLIFFIENHVKLHSVHLNDDQDITTAVTVAVGNAAVLHMLPCAPRHPLQSCPAAHGHNGAHMRPRSTCCHVRITRHHPRPNRRPQAPPLLYFVPPALFPQEGKSASNTYPGDH